MSKMTGLEEFHQIPPKVLQMYNAVIRLLDEGENPAGLRVSTITDRAGIGKGTAYDYFDTKEDIVACAVVFHIQRIFCTLKQDLEKQDSFEKQLCWLLDEVDKETIGKHCFIRFVHILTDNSEFSRQVRQKMMTEPFAQYHPVKIFGDILKRGVDRKEIRDDLPIEFMVCTVFSGLLTYMMSISTEECFEISPEKMRPLVYQQILSELCIKKV